MSNSNAAGSELEYSPPPVLQRETDIPNLKVNPVPVLSPPKLERQLSIDRRPPDEYLSALQLVPVVRIKSEPAQYDDCSEDDEDRSTVNMNNTSQRPSPIQQQQLPAEQSPSPHDKGKKRISIAALSPEHSAPSMEGGSSSSQENSWISNQSNERKRILERTKRFLKLDDECGRQKRERRCKTSGKTRDDGTQAGGQSQVRTPARRQSPVLLRAGGEPPVVRTPAGGQSHVPRSRAGGKTPEQIRFLTSKFEENQFPSPSELMQMSEDTRLSVPQIRGWFTAERNKRSARSMPIQSPVSEFDSSSRTISNGTENEAANHTRGDENNELKTRFVKLPSDRTSDVSHIRADIKRVQVYPFAEFTKILNGAWQIKAKRIYQLYTREDCGMKSVVYREAGRIKDNASDRDPFSEEQVKAVEEWKRDFVNKMWQVEEKGKKVPSVNTRTYISHTVEQVVMPWLRPFMYGRIVKQNGRCLSLLVALYDFYRISGSLGSGDFQILEWQVPGLLQRDLPTEIPVNLPDLPERLRYIFLCSGNNNSFINAYQNS